MTKLCLAALISLLTFHLSAIAEEASSENIVEGNIGMYSQYIWRGKQESSNPLMMGELEAELGAGFSANLEFASPLGNSPEGGSITEIDLGITYAFVLDKLNIKVGYLHSAYINHAAVNTGEIVAGLDYGPLAITYYYAVFGGVNSWKKDQYVDAQLSADAIGIHFKTNLGFYIPTTGSSKKTEFPTQKKELGHVDFSASKTFQAGELSFSPSVMLSIPTYTNKPSNANQLVLGLSAQF